MTNTAETQKVDPIFYVENYLYEVFFAAAQKLGNKPDLTDPTAANLAKLMTEAAASIAVIDARIGDRLNQASATQEQPKEEPYKPIGGYMASWYKSTPGVANSG